MLSLNYNTNIIEFPHHISKNIVNKESLAGCQQALQTIKDRLNEKNISDSTKKEYEQYLKDKEKQIADINIVLNKSSTAMEKIDAKINVMKSVIKEIENGKLVTGENISQYKSELNFLQYLSSHKIPESTSEHSAVKFMFNMFNEDSPLITLILTVLLSSDIITKELEESTIKLMLVQPVSRIKVLSGKYLALLASVALIIFSSIAGAFIIVGIKDGFGNLRYPYIYGMKYTGDFFNYIEGSGRYISAGAFLMRSILFFILFAVAGISVGFMISSLSRSSSMSISLGIIINLLLIYIVRGTKLTKKFNQFIYISYYNIFSLLSGEIKSTLKNNAVTPLNGILVLSALTVICCIVSYVSFAKKDL